ncbi:MAG: glycoside hydrolase family 16 protein [Actinomycetota bacterium]
MIRRSVFVVVCALLLASVPSTAAVAVAASPTPRATVPGGYRHLAFRDDFSGTTVDRSRWTTCYPWGSLHGCTNGGNDEQEWYLPSQVTESAGALHLTADVRKVHHHPYVSGMVTTWRRFSFEYGYLQATMRVPAGQGFWPAFWLLPADGSWPPEVDIMEVLGNRPTKAYFTTHGGTPQQVVSAGGAFNGADLSVGWHTYGLRWTAHALTWYLDGVERFRTTRLVPHVPMYLIVNLAVGGSWPGNPDQTTPFPSELAVDSVRVWT